MNIEQVKTWMAPHFKSNGEELADLYTSVIQGNIRGMLLEACKKEGFDEGITFIENNLQEFSLSFAELYTLEQMLNEFEKQNNKSKWFTRKGK